MSEASFSVLLIEDNQDDAEQLGETLAAVHGSTYSMTQRSTLAEGLKAQAAGSFDIVLLDLGLPDSQGLETLMAAQAGMPDMPIVVLTGEADETSALKAVQMGAQDYVRKGEATPETLDRAMRFAVERQRVHIEHATTVLGQRELREAEYLRRLADASPSAKDHRDAPSVRDSAPQRFARLVESYRRALGHAVEMQQYRVTHPISQELRAMAQELASFKAEPRDVVDIHLEAVRSLTGRASQQRTHLIHDEGRLLALELMGYLAGLYREYALGEPTTFDAKGRSRLP